MRLDERTKMMLEELSMLTGTTVSVIIRGIVQRSVESLLDKAGNWNLDNEKRGKE